MSALAMRLPDDTEYVPDDAPLSYWLWNGVWWLHHPAVGTGCLAKHAVVVHDDGTITASPSIKIWGWRGMVHGYLERGCWRDV